MILLFGQAHRDLSSWGLAALHQPPQAGRFVRPGPALWHGPWGKERPRSALRARRRARRLRPPARAARHGGAVRWCRCVPSLAAQRPSLPGLIAPSLPPPWGTCGCCGPAGAVPPPPRAPRCASASAPSPARFSWAPSTGWWSCAPAGTRWGPRLRGRVLVLAGVLGSAVVAKPPPAAARRELACLRMRLPLPGGVCAVPDPPAAPRRRLLLSHGAVEAAALWSPWLKRLSVPLKYSICLFKSVAVLDACHSRGLILSTTWRTVASGQIQKTERSRQRGGEEYKRKLCKLCTREENTPTYR